MDLFAQAVDLDERRLYQQSPDILKLLLKDRTTKRHIVWGTSSYEYLGKGFESYSPITVKQLTTYHKLIQPRSEKTRSEQKARTKVNAEVFTPTWLVKKQTDFAEEDLLDLSLEDYTDQRWLEITCGEAPYIVTRYDAVSGELLPLSSRVGFLDRKLARISEAVTSESQWLTLVKKAYQASYGYEWQGDSLLLARENLLLTFEDYYEAKFAKKASLADLKEIATIISYNLFQMDGLNHISLSTDSQAESKQLSLFDDIQILDTVEIKTQIKNWKTKKMLGFERLASGETEMKFDVVIGNPPYQEEAQGTSTSDDPIYHYFMDSSKEIASKSILITPARFLFNAGKTPKKWNKAILNNPHYKVCYYTQNSSEVFPNTDIKGGVAITYFDNDKEFGEIGTFTPFNELNSILKKVEKSQNFKSITEIIYTQSKFNLDTLYNDFPNYRTIIGSNGKDKRLRKPIFSRLDVFTENSIGDDYKILGRLNNERVFRYIPKKYIAEHPNLLKYKVLVPTSNGSGAIGEKLSTPLIGYPLIGYTDTFISFGAFDLLSEAENMLKYIQSKFCRTMLGVLKITQDNTAEKWAKVPLQDFTVNSDIDWSQSVADIDRQLYQKYNLSQEEIDFIEEKVKAME
ncbi:Eco57I restriction-modification methylase domain-containing protein [Streptococcus sp. FT1-55]|uniref:Eco57I restriction-modification methylase domain-containing protein n=1 Tax=Streptococcus sp. FT1-55 TaxID=3409805 RepID=UPI003BF4876B